MIKIFVGYLSFLSLIADFVHIEDDGDGNKTEESVRVQPMASNNKGTVSSTVVSDGLRAGWPTILTLLTRDQYGRLVHVPNLKVN